MNKGILFFLGLLVGVLCCVLIYRFDKKMFDRVSLQNKKVKEVVVTRIDTVYVETLPKQKKPIVENKSDGPITEANIEDGQDDEVSIYDAEFSFERQDDEVFSDQLLQTRTVKVKVLNPEKQEKLPENFLQFFEIQQWSTPIKNRLTYYRNQSMLKIKGMEIDQMNIVFWNNAYFLEVRNRYYAIPETEYFEKLNVVILPQ